MLNMPFTLEDFILASNPKRHLVGWADFEFLSWILLLVYLWPQVTDRKGIGYFSKSPEEVCRCHKDPLEGENH